MDLERLLQGKRPEVIALYHRFIELVQACGPFTCAVSKSAITLTGTRRGFAGAVPGERALRGYLDLPRLVQDPRITRSSPYTKRLYVHHFRIDRHPSSTSSSPAGWARPTRSEPAPTSATPHKTGPDTRAAAGHRHLTAATRQVTNPGWSVSLPGPSSRSELPGLA